jgi:ubiquinone/menaquinone biosynthesis C-methylase UbiE
MTTDFKIHTLRHYKLVKNALPKKSLKILDCGCGTGEFLSGLRSKNWKLYGVEVDPDRLKIAIKRNRSAHLKQMKVGAPLPYKDSTFDVVTLFHVLEHVDSEKRILKEIARILKPGGILFLASPYYGFFTWADTANARYAFPKLHKWIMKLILGNQVYLQRFEKNKNNKLYGDCSINRTWHKHYKESEIRELLKKQFEIDHFDKFSFFHPILLLLYNLSDYIFGRHLYITRYLLYLDNCIHAGEYSYNMLVTAHKK